MEEILNQVEAEIRKRNVTEEQISSILSANKDITNRRIIGGYASADIIDRENQRIPIPALKDAVIRFMKNTFLRPVNIFHSDVQVGRVLPKWTNPKTGETLETTVDSRGWWCVCELRDDVELADRVWNEIGKGNIRSFSVAGASKEKLQKQEGGVHYEQIKELDFFELTLCETPVNQLSKFDVLWNPQAVEI